MPATRALRTAAALLLVTILPRVAAAGETSSGRPGGTPTGQHPAALEAEVDARMRTALELLYQTRLPEAARVAAELRQLAPRDPRVHLLEARILRETFPDQNAGDGNVASVSAPIHGELQQTIDLCDSLLRLDDSNVGAHLYRGWAYLFRAQMHTLCDQYWDAGRTAKRGKSSLDRALELDPDNADAKGVLGTYFYFADVLPRVVKILRTLVRVPGGDRVRGLEMLQESAAGDGYNRLDARALLGAIQFAFEGDYEDGRSIFESLLRDFPNNPRMLEPVAALDLVQPRPGTGERVAAVAQMYAGHPADWYRQMSQRLTFYRALSEAVQGRVDDAITRLEEIHAASPTEPDWFPGDVLLCLTEMHLLVGDREHAVRLHASVSRQARLEERLRFAKEPGAAATPPEAQVFRGAQDAARALYAGDLEAAGRQLATFATADDPSVHFYRGELSRLQGDVVHAVQDYERVTDRPWPKRWRLYKVLAYSRLAEMQGMQGNAVAAAATLDHALMYDEDRDLLRHLLRARKRHFEITSNSGANLTASSPAAATADGDSR